MASLRHQKTPVIGILFEVLNRDLGLLFLCNVLGAFGDGLFSVQLPIYLSDNLKATATEIGILYAVMSLLAALTLLVAGLLADKYDRKKIMIAGWIAWIPAPLIFSIAGNWVQALPGMVLWGFWFGGPTPTADIVARSGVPLKILASGGTNSRTRSLADLCGVTIHGVSLGTFARKAVRGWISQEDFDGDIPALAEAVAVAGDLVRRNIGG